MVLIIDGYNLLKHIDPYRNIDEHVRTTFLHMLKRYAARKKHKLVVVFDGGPYEWPHKETDKAMVLIYSGRRETADKVIMHYIKDHKSKDILLVSSDHELILFASKYDKVSIGSQDFYHLVQTTFQEQPQSQDPVITFDENEQDLDTVMEQASEVVPHKQEDRERANVQNNAHKSSKQDRLLLKKLKKL